MYGLHQSWKEVLFYSDQLRLIRTISMRLTSGRRTLHVLELLHSRSTYFNTAKWCMECLNEHTSDYLLIKEVLLNLKASTMYPPHYSAFIVKLKLQLFCPKFSLRRQLTGCIRSLYTACLSIPQRPIHLMVVSFWRDKN